MHVQVISDVYEICVYANRHRQICIPAHEHPPRNARSSRALLRSSSPAATSTSRCQARPRGHMWPVSRVSSPFSRVKSRERHQKRAARHSLLNTLVPLTSMVLPASVNEQPRALQEQLQLEGAVSRVDSSLSRVRSRKRQGKRAAGHRLLHTVVTWTSMVLAAGLHMHLGTLREQPQLRGNCFAKKRKLRGPENACRLRKSAHALAALDKVPGSELMRIRGQYSTLVRPQLALARGGMAKPADLPVPDEVGQALAQQADAWCKI